MAGAMNNKTKTRVIRVKFRLKIKMSKETNKQTKTFKLKKK